jgi:hypothetical protein
MITASPSTFVTSWITTVSTPSGKHGAGHDPHRLASADFSFEGAPGKRRADVLQPRFATGGKVGEAQRPAVHRRVVVAGHVDRRNNVRRQHAIQRLAHEDALDAGDRRQQAEDQFARARSTS